MKIALFISALAVIFSACSSSQSFTQAQEDDIYYVPGKRSLFAQEIKNKTGVDIDINQRSNSQDNSTANKKNYSGEVDNSVNPRSHALGMARYATEKQVQKAEEKTGQPVVRAKIPEGDGHWIGGFKGTDNDLEECVRIMNRYPEGFAYFGNGYEIAQNLSFNSDWNVYTVDNRYWWFPSNSNIGLYSQLIFGNYPKYIWTVAWNEPRFNSFAWNSCANFGFGNRPFHGNHYMGNHWGWNGTFGWGNSWGYDPFWNNGWWGHNTWGWNSWDYYGYNSGWGNPHWGHRPGWGHHSPNWGNHRPEWGGANKPSYTTRYAPKKQYTTNRNARSYSTYSRTSRSSTTNRTYDRSNSKSNYNPSNNSGNSGSYSRGSSSGSYGSSSTTRSSRGSSDNGGRVERTNTGHRK